MCFEPMPCLGPLNPLEDSMTLISQLFSTQDVLLDVELPDKQALFEAVGHLWESNYGVAAAKVVNSLSARERLGSTGLGQGVAIPHARCAGVDRSLMAFVRSKSAIEFDAPDHLPVDCFVFLLVPEGTVDPHLQLLADVAKTLSNAKVRDELRVAQTPDKVNRLFSGPPDQCFEILSRPTDGKAAGGLSAKAA
jgi:PTS system nitrogen regulatory IIA component